MFSNILLAVDGSEASLQAARKGIALASCLNAKVTEVAVTVPWAEYFARELAVVVPDVVVPEPEYDDKRNASAAGILQGVETDARSAGVDVKSVQVPREVADIVDIGQHTPSRRRDRDGATERGHGASKPDTIEPQGIPDDAD